MGIDGGDWATAGTLIILIVITAGVIIAALISVIRGRNEEDE